MRRLSRQEWIDGAFEALCDGGMEAIRVEPLAASLGVTKGSFYWHFENRRALHLALLDAWERTGTHAIIELVDAELDNPRAALRLLAHTVFAADDRADAIETAIRGWAQHEPNAAEAIARIDARRVDFVASLLRRVGVDPPAARRRSRLMYRALIGEFFWRSIGGPATTKREIDEMVDLLMASGD